jgi:GNAT superfamily N-acetyltransferase
MDEDEAVAFTAGSHSVRPLAADDGTALQQLLESDPDYFLTSFGVPPGPAEAQSLFVALPPESTYEHKLLLGAFSESGSFDAILDVIRDHPGPGEWALGFLFVAPAARRGGLGASLYVALAAWAKERGARRFRARVPRKAPGAVPFLSRCGFEETEAGRSDDDNVVMVHDLSGH